MRKNTKERKEIRRKAALLRQQDRAKRSPKEQLARLDQLLGKNMGAKKERTRLNYLIHSK